MKRIILIISIIYSVNSWGAQYSFTGSVNMLRSHDLSFFGKDVDWFALNGFTSAGNCKPNGGYMVIRLRDDSRSARQFSMVLAALESGKNLTVWVDDTITDANGYCYLSFMDIKP